MPLNWKACRELAKLSHSPVARLYFRPGLASCFYMSMVVPLRIWRSRLPLPLRFILVLTLASVGFVYQSLGIVVYGLPVAVLVVIVLVAGTALIFLPVFLLAWLLGLVGLGSAATAMLAFVSRYIDKITHGISITHDIHEARAKKREEHARKEHEHEPDAPPASRLSEDPPSVAPPPPEPARPEPARPAPPSAEPPRR
jgi:hypothetical protein